MKILILNSVGKFTGEAAHSLDLTQQLIAQGHDAQLVLREGSIVVRRAQERGLPVVAQLHFDGGLACTIEDFLRLRKLIARERPDIVHAHRGNDHGHAVAAVLGRAKRPTIVRTRHRVQPVQNRFFNRWLHVRGTDGIMAVSEKAAASFGKMRPLIEDKLSVIYSSVDMERFHPGRRNNEWRMAHGISDEHMLIGLIARLQRVKGQEQFLRAAAKVAAKFPAARFLVAGSGPPHKLMRMQKLVEELGIADKVLFMEWLADIHEVTASLDVGVLASLSSEGSSRVTYEYMASGVPVVASGVGCIPEVVEDAKTGFVVPPGDPDALSDAIMRLLNDREARAAMASQALVRIGERHTRSRWIADVINVYNRAIESRRSQSSWRAALQGYARILKN